MSLCFPLDIVASCDQYLSLQGTLLHYLTHKEKSFCHQSSSHTLKCVCSIPGLALAFNHFAKPYANINILCLTLMYGPLTPVLPRNPFCQIKCVCIQLNFGPTGSVLEKLCLRNFCCQVALPNSF